MTDEGLLAGSAPTQMRATRGFPDADPRPTLQRVTAPPQARDCVRPVGGWPKRLFDILASAAALLFCAPLLMLIALIVRLDSAGHAFFQQERGGFRGRKFRIWKFRTMTVVEDGPAVVQATASDVRVTRVGRFLRKASLDELPQLVNVLVGEMSIIGPRPHALVHDARFADVDPRYLLRTRARPGITGLAQVSGCRGPTETPEKIRARTSFDLTYVENWSVALDLRILARTIGIILKLRAF